MFGFSGVALQPQDITFERLMLDKQMEAKIQGYAGSANAIPAKSWVFADAESWRAFWAKYGMGKSPLVDFTKHQIAVVSLEAMPHPGYGVEISKIIYSPSEEQIVIHVTEWLPGTGGYTQNQGYPADFALFPQMTGSHKFEHTKKSRTP